MTIEWILPIENACFWGSGFIDLGSQLVVQMTEETTAYNKGEIYEK